MHKKKHVATKLQLPSVQTKTLCLFSLTAYEYKISSVLRIELHLTMINDKCSKVPETAWKRGFILHVKFRYHRHSCHHCHHPDASLCQASVNQ